MTQDYDTAASSNVRQMIVLHRLLTFGWQLLRKEGTHTHTPALLRLLVSLLGASNPAAYVSDKCYHSAYVDKVRRISWRCRGTTRSSSYTLACGSVCEVHGGRCTTSACQTKVYRGRLSGVAAQALLK